jgi:hypothetical protein
MEVTYTSQGIVLSQKKLTHDLLTAAADMLSSASVCTPLPMHCKLTEDAGELLSDPTTYRTDVGKFNFLTNTRPDLAFAVQMLSQFMHQPRTSHWSALLHTLQYVGLLDKAYCFMLMRV